MDDGGVSPATKSIRKPTDPHMSFAALLEDNESEDVLPLLLPFLEDGDEREAAAKAAATTLERGVAVRSRRT